MKNISGLFLILLLTFTGQKVQSQTSLLENNNQIELPGGGPCYNLSANTVVCSGEVYTFPDGTFQTITAQVIHTSNLLTVVTSCDSIITTTVNALPTYNLQQSFFNICTGVDYTFPDGSTQTIQGHTEYTSYLQTVNSLCDSTILTILNTTDLTVAVNVSGNTLTAQQGNAGYQWLDCDNGAAQISGANDQTYSAPSGNFAVIIFKGNCTDTSACYQTGTVGIHDINANDVFVYPNPTNGLFKIKLGTTYSKVNVIIRNVVGQQVYAQTLRNTSLFDVSLKADEGMYFIELQGSEGLSVSYKIIME